MSDMLQLVVKLRQTEMCRTLALKLTRYFKLELLDIVLVSRFGLRAGEGASAPSTNQVVPDRTDYLGKAYFSHYLYRCSSGSREEN